MRIIAADDNSMHLTLIQSVLKTALGSSELEFWKTPKNGLEAVAAVKEAKEKNVKIDLVTLDIRMPEMDGLSALVQIRALNPLVKILMASSEDEKSMKKYSTGQIAEMPAAQKIQLLEKVKDRVLKGIKEEGKINFILDACEELLFDPIEASKHFRANGYLHKPYQVESVKFILDQVFKGGAFITKAA
jgi:two-component system response regulator YesN